ncbi:MAG: SCP2 sterol-binding domain-containing protein [Candidatus Helarchaeota archaeon]
MAVINLWDALSEFQNIINNTKSIQVELQKWGDRTIQFLVKGGQDCFVRVQNGRILLEKGKKETSDLVFTALDGYLVKLITGQEDYTSLEIMGNISFKGTEVDKNKFVSIIGLFVDALLGETDL